jgi:outer membrane lipoprotein SlyB
MKERHMSTSAEVIHEPQLSVVGTGDAGRKGTETVAESSLQRPEDIWISRMVVGALAFSVLAGIVGAIVLQGFDKKIPDVLLASVAGLAGLLVPSPMSKR